eukprot:TRINITY_DN1971_c0_g1_i1.p1 TRINITY_DN1971_c0_g1~~TRINITY_DN1971_c0_g1_i1.p1  ORF type:complete len:148 (-),score=47.20 TRINITY_DN1971_c0_g1_i1:395-838(-)
MSSSNNNSNGSEDGDRDEDLIKLSKEIEKGFSEQMQKFSNTATKSLEKKLDNIKRKRESLDGERQEFEKEMAQKKEEFEKEKQVWGEISQKFAKSVPSSGRVKLDVGGTLFTTSIETLTSYKGSFFDAMFSGRQIPLEKRRGWHNIY